MVLGHEPTEVSSIHQVLAGHGRWYIENYGFNLDNAPQCVHAENPLQTTAVEPNQAAKNVRSANANLPTPQEQQKPWEKETERRWLRNRWGGEA